MDKMQKEVVMAYHLLEGLKKTMKNVGQYSQCPERYMNQALPEYK
jgi:hypothetical protein